LLGLESYLLGGEIRLEEILKAVQFVSGENRNVGTFSGKLFRERKVTGLHLHFLKGQGRKARGSENQRSPLEESST